MVDPDLRVRGGRVDLHWPGNGPALHLEARNPHASFRSAEHVVPEVHYRVEQRRGYVSSGQLFIPGNFTVQLARGEDVTLLATCEDPVTLEALPPEDSLHAECERRHRLLAVAHRSAREGLAAELVLAADQFLIYPASRVHEAIRLRAEGDDARTVIAGGISQPAGLAAAGGDLYVADRAGSLLQVLRDNKPLDPPRVVATGLAGPEGMAAGEDGSLYVVEVEAGRVVQVDPKTGATTLVADGLTLASLEQKSIGKNTPVGFLTGIAVGKGSLYVTSYAKNLVYRIDR